MTSVAVASPPSSLGSAIERLRAEPLGVRVLHLVGEPLAAQDEDEAVLADGLDERLHAVELDLLQLGAEFGATLGRDAAGAAVGDLAVGVDGAEVAARGDVGGLQVEVDAGGLEDAAADRVDHRVVAEEREVAGPAAGRDAVADRQREAARAVAGDVVEVRRPGGFELGAAGLRVRQAAEAVHDEQHDLGVGLLGKLADEVEVHAFRLCGMRGAERQLLHRVHCSLSTVHL